ncbi:unnamed protein product [Pylaiella littoralis]
MLTDLGQWWVNRTGRGLKEEPGCQRGSSVAAAVELLVVTIWPEMFDGRDHTRWVPRGIIVRFSYGAYKMFLARCGSSEPHDVGVCRVWDFPFYRCTPNSKECVVKRP